MFSTEWRLAAAVAVGVMLDAVFFWKFLPYATREHGPDILPWYFLPILTFAAGLLITLAAQGRKRWVPLALLGGCCVAHTALVVADCASDPTNHNLWPFEFVIIAIAIAPAFAGAGLSALIDRLRASAG